MKVLVTSSAAIGGVTCAAGLADDLDLEPL